MNSRIPRGNALWLWRAHFCLSVALTLQAAWQFVIAVAEAGAGASSFSLWDMAVFVLGAILLVGPLVAEWGLLTQRAIETHRFWTALFVVIACLFAAGTLITIVVAFWSGSAPLASREDFINLAESLVAAGQLWALWIYAYRSDHLWGVLGKAESM